MTDGLTLAGNVTVFELSLSPLLRCLHPQEKCLSQFLPLLPEEMKAKDGSCCLLI
jgi:hypothetical protein